MSLLRPLTGAAAALALVLAQSPPETTAKQPSASKAKTASKAPAKSAGASQAKAKTPGKTSPRPTSKRASSKKSATAKTAARKGLPTTKKGSTATKRTTTATASKKSSAAAAKAGAKGKRALARRPVGQQRPTSERYKEIEAALHERGYLTDSPSGQWTAASVDALRRFQADEDLPVTGHLDSLSLIRLGLGPERQ